MMKQPHSLDVIGRFPWKSTKVDENCYRNFKKGRSRLWEETTKYFQTSTGVGKNPQILFSQIKIKNSCFIFAGYLMNERAEQIVHEF